MPVAVAGRLPAAHLRIGTFEGALVRLDPWHERHAVVDTAVVDTAAGDPVAAGLSALGR